MSSPEEKADALKEKGNVAFKANQLLEASKLYARAEATAPTEHVYPANLSAALYEMGDYRACLDAISRSHELSSTNPGLSLRLSTRLAKTLCQGLRGGSIDVHSLKKHAKVISELEIIAMQQGAVEPLPECIRVWREWRNTEGRPGGAREARIRLAQIPIARRGLNPMLQYFPVGQDEMLSLFDDWGPRDPYPLKISAFTKTQLGDLSFLFGGVGDARNVYATLVGAHRAYKALPKDKRAAMRIHLTLLDIHPSVLARDLCILMLMNDWMEPNVEPSALTEIKATLIYTFMGAIVPSYCHARLQKTIKNLQTRLSETPPRLPPWVQVNPEAIPEILASLAYWANTTTKTACGMVAGIKTGQGSSILAMLKHPGLTEGYRATLQQRIARPLGQINQLLDSFGAADLRRLDYTDLDLSDAETMRQFKQRRPQIVELLLEEHLSGNGPPRLMKEDIWFQFARAYVPPKELWSKHPEMAGWKKYKKKGDFPSDLKVALKTSIEGSWKPNMTLFDRHYSEVSNKSLPQCKGYPDVVSEGMLLPKVIDDFNRRFGIDTGGQLPADPDSPAFTHATRFFQGAIDGLKALQGSITLEILYGGLTQELAKMQLGTDTSRPTKFPRTFSRAYISNIPDYTHGILNTAIFIVPSLKVEPQAVVASNSMLNSSAWQNNDDFCHNYSLLHPRDVPRFLGCSTIRMDGIMGLITLGAKKLPVPLSELASRVELIRWLTRIFLYVCVPGTPGFQQVRVRMPNNLAVFVNLLFHLHAVGYPGHWLSEFLQTILTDTMVTDVVPYTGQWPIPLADLERRGEKRRVRLDPWLAELENILACAHEAIPFAVHFPNDFASVHSDIGIYEAVVQQRTGVETGRYATAPVEDPVVSLLFYRPSNALTVDALVKLVPSILEGRAREPYRGDIHILTSQELADIPGRKVRWRLSGARVNKMRKDGWSMVVYRTDSQQTVTVPVPAKQWIEVLNDIEAEELD